MTTTTPDGLRELLDAMDAFDMAFRATGCSCGQCSQCDVLSIDLSVVATKIEKIFTDTIEQRDREIAELRGITPEFPPRPPDGEGTPRYGVKWNGPQTPLAVPMVDGYWTPWHLAQAIIDSIRAQLAEARKDAGCLQRTDDGFQCDRCGVKLHLRFDGCGGNGA